MGYSTASDRALPMQVQTEPVQLRVWPQSSSPETGLPWRIRPCLVCREDLKIQKSYPVAAPSVFVCPFAVFRRTYLRCGHHRTRQD